MEGKQSRLLSTLPPGPHTERAAPAFTPKDIHGALGRGLRDGPPPFTVSFGFYFVDNKKWTISLYNGLLPASADSKLGRAHFLREAKIRILI